MTSEDDPTAVRPPQTAFGALVQKTRGDKKVRPLAIAAGISEARWRQVEKGYQPAGSGIYIPAKPSARTVRGMAAALGLNVAEAFAVAGVEPDAVPELEVSQAVVEDHDIVMLFNVDHETREDMLAAAVAVLRSATRARTRHKE